MSAFRLKYMTLLPESWCCLINCNKPFQRGINDGYKVNQYRRFTFRWIRYEPVGAIIPNTRFVVFKTPLGGALAKKIPKEKRFDVSHLLRTVNPSLCCFIFVRLSGLFVSIAVFRYVGEMGEGGKGIICPQAGMVEAVQFFRRFLGCTFARVKRE